MYPVGLCLHILPDVLWRDYCGFLAEPSRLCLGAFGFYLNVTKQAGFRSPWLFLFYSCDFQLMRYCGCFVLMYLYNKRGCYVGTCTI